MIAFWRTSAAILLLFGCVAPEPLTSNDAVGHCAFGAKPVTLVEEGRGHEDGSKLLEVWMIDDRPELWKSPPRDVLENFRSQVRGRAGVTDTQTLLRQADTPNNALVASNPSWVKPIRCIEAVLFARQNERIPIFSRSTEFAAFILRSHDGAKLKIYYYTRNEDGIGNVSALIKPVGRDVSEGWTLEASLHNHNFHPGNPPLNGMISPSGPDAALYQSLAAELGLREAWITNGIDTSHIPAAAFSRLSAFNMEKQK